LKAAKFYPETFVLINILTKLQEPAAFVAICSCGKNKQEWPPLEIWLPSWI